MPERKIGEKFYFEGEWLKVVECDTCKDCVFGRYISVCAGVDRGIVGMCAPEYRTDKKSVVFIQTDPC